MVKTGLRHEHANWTCSFEGPLSFSHPFLFSHAANYLFDIFGDLP